jgi:D-apionolactonase
MLTETPVASGQADPPADLLPLRAGPLQLLYDPATGFVRRLRLGQREVLRGIYAAVRDHNWDTIPGVMRETARVIGPDSFQIEFESVHQRDDVHFVWCGMLVGEADGTLRYTFDGQARSTFRRNRIGFCVLHPIRECAGAAARQKRVDGRVVACRFPVEIEPQIFGHASFRDLRGLAHQVDDALWAELEFAGDIFEMEDQRNWTDASFKTYCTPLALPFPVEIRAGTRVHQSVTLRLADAQNRLGNVEAAQPGVAEVTLPPPAAPRLPMPRLGLGLASHCESLTDGEFAQLRSLPLAHLRVDLKLGSADWPSVWERAVREAGRLGIGLELALLWPREGEADASEFQRRLRSSSVPIARVLALREGEAATTPQTLALARQVVADWNVPVGGGSDANFCELNREQALGRFPATEADFLFWSINPQVHAFDDRSVMQTLEAQSDTVKSARAFSGTKPLVISPVTLKQRFNPVATGPEPAPPPGELPRPVDPRQRTPFGAAWTLGSFAALAASGAQSVTFYETTGWRGVMETATGSPLPQKFPSQPGEVFPVFHVFAALAGFDRIAPVATDSRLAALALFKAAGGGRLLLANLTDAPLEISVGWRADGCARVLA